MSNEQKLREAFDLGWKMAANWSLSDHLLADMESPAYLIERDGRLLTISLPTTPPAAAPAPAVPQGEPVAVIGSGWQFLWASGDAIEDIVKRHGLKIGSKLYATPAAPLQPVTLTDEDIDNLARKHAGDPSCSGAWGSTYEFEPSELRAFVNEIAALREKERAK